MNETQNNKEYDFARELDDELASDCPGGCGKSSYLCECPKYPSVIYYDVPGPEVNRYSGELY